ncbi:MAG: sigma-70 family RNA polymerase sigma factor [Ilumatobacteraceae bacterium]
MLKRAAGRSALTDERVARLLRRGDAGALEAVYERYGAVVFGYLRGALGDNGRAEDVLQQVMTEVWARAERYDPARGSLITWIMLIARSRAIDELRRSPAPTWELSGDRDVALAVNDDDELVERWRIADLLRRLPADEHEVLRLRFYAALSQTEIAERTDTPLGTVKAQMVRGLSRLRVMVGEPAEVPSRPRRAVDPVDGPHREGVGR